MPGKNIYTYIIWGKDVLSHYGRRNCFDQGVYLNIVKEGVKRDFSRSSII